MSIPDDYQTKKKNGLQLLWITPLRALAKDIGRAMEEVIIRIGHEMESGYPQWRYANKRTTKTKKTNAGSADHYTGKFAFITGTKRLSLKFFSH